MAIHDNRYYLQFNGSSSYVDCSNNVANLELTTFSFSAWIKPTTTADNKVIYYNGDLTANRTGWGVVVRQNDDGSYPNKLYLETSADGTPTLVYGDEVNYAEWQHIAITFDSSTQTTKIYQNGALVTDDTGTCDIPTFTGDNFVRIGAIEQSSDNEKAAFFNGNIDDICIWSRVLTTSEIADLYKGKVSTTNLVSRWKCNDRTGSTLTDSVGDNDGTITNGTWGHELHPTEFNESSDFNKSVGFIVPEVTKDCLYDQIKYAGRVGTINCSMNYNRHYDTTTDSSNTFTATLSSVPTGISSSLTLYVTNYSIIPFGFDSNVFEVKIMGYSE